MVFFVHFCMSECRGLSWPCKTCALPVSRHHILSGETPRRSHPSHSSLKKKQRLSFLGVCHLYRKRTKKSLFLIISVHLLTVIGSHFLRIFVNLYNDSDPFGPVCLLFTWICFHISEGVSGKWLLLPTEEMWGRVQDILWVRRKWGLALRNQM